MEKNNDQFVSQVFTASLALMSILIAVIAILAGEYRDVVSDPVLADPLWYLVVGTTSVAVFAGLIAILSLVHLRGYCKPTQILFWAFVILIVLVVVGIPLVVRKLL